MTSQFDSVKLKTLRERLDNLFRQYEVVSGQINTTLSDAEKVKLQLKLDNIEEEIKDVEKQANEIAESGAALAGVSSSEQQVQATKDLSQLDTEIADLRRKIAALEEKIKSKSLSLMGKLAVFGIALLLLVIAVRWVPFEMANPLERPTETASLVAFTASELTQVSLEDIDSQSAMFTSEPSALETPQPSATTSDLPTDTPTETYTPTLTETHTPPPNPTLTVTMSPPTVRIIVSSANLRAGPGTSYAIVGSIREGETAVVLATNSDGDWYNVELSDGKRVWIAKSNTEPVDSANMGELSVAVTIPPLPTPSATTSPTFTPVAPETHSTPFAPSPTFTPRY